MRLRGLILQSIFLCTFWQGMWWVHVGTFLVYRYWEIVWFAGFTVNCYLGSIILATHIAIIIFFMDFSILEQPRCWRFFNGKSFSISKFRSLIIWWLDALVLAISILVCYSQRWKNIVKCNLLFDLIGHFGILKDVNIAFFL